MKLLLNIIGLTLGALLAYGIYVLALRIYEAVVFIWME